MKITVSSAIQNAELIYPEEKSIPTIVYSYEQKSDFYLHEALRLKEYFEIRLTAVEGVKNIIWDFDSPLIVSCGEITEEKKITFTKTSPKRVWLRTPTLNEFFPKSLGF
ncbi:hypothetical protein J4474_01270 [Candidatus Pacearchaeota archaeon]|nr:hypothetical protein [Candidatus Pacearchaeota archaeon]